nr:hypothetical protein [Helicobacter pylori]
MGFIAPWRVCRVFGRYGCVQILKLKFKYGVSLICLIESAILYFASKDLFWIVALTIFSLSLILVAFKIFLLKDNPNKRFKNNKRDKR